LSQQQTSSLAKREGDTKATSSLLVDTMSDVTQTKPETTEERKCEAGATD